MNLSSKHEVHAHEYASVYTTNSMNSTSFVFEFEICALFHSKNYFRDWQVRPKALFSFKEFEMGGPSQSLS